MCICEGLRPWPACRNIPSLMFIPMLDPSISTTLGAVPPLLFVIAKPAVQPPQEMSTSPCRTSSAQLPSQSSP